MGDYEKAIETHQQCFDSLESIMPEAHPGFGTLLNTYAVTLQKMERHEEALPLLERGYHHAKEHLGDYHPRTIIRLNNLANGYEHLEKTEKASASFKELTKAVYFQISRRFPYLSDQLQISLLKNLQVNLDAKNTFVHRHPEQTEL